MWLICYLINLDRKRKELRVNPNKVNPNMRVVKRACPCLLLFIMLSYEQHQLLFRLGEYSSEMSSLQYSGLNPDWVRRPPYSEPSARQALNPPAKPYKPFSATATTRLSELDNQVLVDDNAPPRLHSARNHSNGSFQPPPPKQNLPDTSDDLDISDSPPPTDANIPKIWVDRPTLEVKN